METTSRRVVFVIKKDAIAVFLAMWQCAYSGQDRAYVAVGRYTCGGVMVHVWRCDGTCTASWRARMAA